MPAIQAFVNVVRDNQKEGMVVCEVGVFKGDTTFAYAPIVKANNGKIVCIDWWEGNISSTGETQYRPDQANTRKAEFISKVKNLGLENTIEIISGNSHDVHNQVKTNSVDILLLDGDHRYSHVKRDLELYQGKVKVNGLFTVHDMEGFEYVNSFLPEQLERDFIANRGMHAGVIQAVFEVFGKSGEVVQSEGVAPLWVRKITHKYFDELKRSMEWLASHEMTVFLGQSVRDGGTGMHSTLKDINVHQRIELPVFEDTQMGLSIGWALRGFVPVSVFPRWNFLLLATNQIVNHLDCLKEMSNGEYQPKVIIRTAVGSEIPLHPGPQHSGRRFIHGFRRMLRNTDVIELDRPEDIFPAYQHAYERTDGKSTILSEVADNYLLK